MQYCGLGLVIGGPALLDLFLTLAFSKSISANFGYVGDANPARRRPFILNVSETHIANVIEIEGESIVVLIESFFFINVEYLYGVFSAYTQEALVSILLRSADGD